jgi:Bacterial conjugation TrbI-like protein
VNLRSSPNDRSAFILIAAQNSSQKESARSWRADLIGQYDSSVAFGQSRVLQVWTRIIMPDGASIVLERQPGADTQGCAGLDDEVDNHWGMLSRPQSFRPS